MAFFAASVIVLGTVVYSGVSRWMDSPLSSMAPGESGRGMSATVDRFEYDIDRIISAKLFGDGKEEANRVARAPETRLQLEIEGMITSEDQRYARALIKVNARKAGVYGVGDRIDDTDATVQSVERNRVLLDRSGVLESLQFRIPRAPLNASLSRVSPAPGGTTGASARR